MAYKITKQQMLDAIKGSQGLVSIIQRRLKEELGQNISWDATERHIHRWKESEEAVRAEKEAMLDIAENRVYKEMLNGDIGTCKWYLKLKGKERGYEDTPVIRMDNVSPLNINLSGSGEMSRDELEDAANVEIGGADEGTAEGLTGDAE